MSFDSAQLFVSEMKTDRNLRETITKISDADSLWKFTSEKGYDFDAKDLAQAMADCMNEMEESG